MSRVNQRDLLTHESLAVRFRSVVLDKPRQGGAKASRMGCLYDNPYETSEPLDIRPDLW